MAEEIVPKEKDAAQIKKLNRTLIGLVAFMVVWSVGMFFYVDRKPEKLMPPIPVIMIDKVTGKVTNVEHAKLLPPHPLLPARTNEVGLPMFEQKSSYDKMDFVIINYFFISGIVVDRDGSDYVVMYKDHNRVLQRVTVPQEFLLSPTSAYGVNPASLLAP